MDDSLDLAMFDKFENCLNKWVTPEKRELYLTAVSVLARHGSYRAWTEISQYIEFAETQDSTSMIVDTIDNCLMIDIERVLEEHTIIVETTMSVMVTILESLLFIDVCEDSQTLLNLLEGSENEMEVLFRLLEFASGKPWEYFSEGILSVSPFLLERMQEILTNKTITTESSVEDNSIETDKLQKLSTFIEKYPNSFVTKAITDDFMHIGMPIDILIEKFKLDIAALQQESAKHSAIEMLGLSLVSDTPFTNAVTKAKSLIEYFFNDIRFMTDVDIALDNIVREVYNG